ncbi:MAG: DNA polymerase III subunit delta', partial [Desulfobulbaceae bacterium]|nr:DNA polymerase III subunit delta' [Desulfobulbaceae bacterium]
MILKFNDILDQGKAKELLLRAVSLGKMGHAFLFKGPAGVGKKTLAQVFAAYLNCRRPENREPCGRCPSCLKFSSGNHPDFILIEPEGAAIKISQVRELIKTLAFPPFEARYRIVLLADIHTMRREAANSLLKTLEEPPADTILILTGDEAGDILATIISRCQVIPFFPLPYEQVAAALSQEGIPGDNAFTLAAMAEGSLGRARLLHQKDQLQLRGEIIDALSSLERNRPATVQAIYDLAEKCAKQKEDLVELLELVKTWFHDLIL